MPGVTRTSGTDASPVVEVSALTRMYADTIALDGVDLTVRRGEAVVLLGRSGSGKSTLLRMINGLDRPDGGRVRTLGLDVAQLGSRQLRALRARVGFVFQGVELVGRLTALENVLAGVLHRCWGPRLGLFAFSLADRRAALERLEEVGVLEHAYRRADVLSGGQQQRVALARALMQQPEILLADEPVASLDPETADQVMSLMRGVAADRGLTVVCSLHQVDLALRWGDRIIGLRSGRSVLDTTAEAQDRKRVMELYSTAADHAGRGAELVVEGPR